MHIVQPEKHRFRFSKCYFKEYKNAKKFSKRQNKMIYLETFGEKKSQEEPQETGILEGGLFSIEFLRTYVYDVR